MGVKNPRDKSAECPRENGTRGDGISPNMGIPRRDMGAPTPQHPHTRVPRAQGTAMGQGQPQHPTRRGTGTTVALHSLTPPSTATAITAPSLLLLWGRIHSPGRTWSLVLFPHPQTTAFAAHFIAVHRGGAVPEPTHQRLELCVNKTDTARCPSRKTPQTVKIHPEFKQEECVSTHPGTQSVWRGRPSPVSARV